MFDSITDFFSGKTYKRGYRIDEKIFSTAFSNIYRGRHRTSGKKIALKILKGQGEKMAKKIDESDSARWEGELLLTLNHPNIVKGLECDNNKEYWLTMEYLESNWSLYIASNRDRIPQSQLIKMFYEIASAIDYLHRQGILHRDIASKNIMIQDNRPKLIDFGLAIPAESDVLRGRLGTPSFMSPEMIRKRVSTYRNDIYSFGIVMYEAVTGIKLFKGKRREERMTRVLNQLPLPLSKMDLETAYSNRLEDLIMRCISKDPDERPKDSREVVTTLKSIQNQESS